MSDQYDAAVDLGFEVDLARSAGYDSEVAHPGALRVWWIRNVPGPATHYRVADLVEALHLYGRLVWHDLQHEDVENNVGGLEVFVDGGWEEWESEEQGLTELTCQAVDTRWIDSFDDLFDAFTDVLRDRELVKQRQE